MTETVMRITKAVKPASAETALLRVIRTAVVSPGFVRVTLSGFDDVLDRTFAPMGYDQWVRLFLSVRNGEPPLMPGGGLDGWYTSWLDLPEDDRAVIRNYTIRDARRVRGSWELDIDFVVHRDCVSGAIEGVAASWAAAASPGDVVGMLDQGTIYSTTPVVGKAVIVADETGLPAAEGIARSLPYGSRAVFILEVPSAEDRRSLPSAAPIDVKWLVRRPGAIAGAAALRALEEVTLGPDDYMYAVGEGSFALNARTLAQNAGVPKDSVHFCAYWRRERRRVRST